MKARDLARAEKRPPRYDGRWRDRDPSEAPEGVKPVIRLRAPLEGTTVLNDAVQGTVTWANKDLDDLVLLRSDGSPTYMLAVVVDGYRREGKRYMTAAIGCTGGKHRSVAMAEALAALLRADDRLVVRVLHRDLGRE